MDDNLKDENSLECKKCLETKHVSNFRIDKNSGSGYYPYCKLCEKSYKSSWYIRNKDRLCLKDRTNRENNTLGVLVQERSKRTKLVFDIKAKDLGAIPKFCPILNIPLFLGKGKTTINSPSLDRLDNNEGYIKGNVWIISHLANRIKSDASDEELYNFCNWVRGVKIYSEVNYDYDASNNLRGCKNRAKRSKLPFDKELSDIVVPKLCPALGIPLFRADGKTFNQNVASVDRIIPELGYVKSNIQIISKKANTMKNCATQEQLLLFADWFFNSRKTNENL